MSNGGFDRPLDFGCAAAPPQALILIQREGRGTGGGIRGRRRQALGRRMPLNGARKRPPGVVAAGALSLDVVDYSGYRRIRCRFERLPLRIPQQFVRDLDLAAAAVARVLRFGGGIGGAGGLDEERSEVIPRGAELVRDGGGFD